MSAGAQHDRQHKPEEYTITSVSACFDSGRGATLSIVILREPMPRGRIQQRFSRVDTEALSGPVYVTKPGRPKQEIRFAPAWMRRRVYERDGGQCQYCGKPVSLEAAQIDHVHPWYHGGHTVIPNFVTACKPCNQRKSAQLIPDSLRPTTLPVHQPPPWATPYPTGSQRHRAAVRKQERQRIAAQFEVP